MRTFASVLKAHGFKRLKSYAKGVACWATATGEQYCEVYTETYGKWAWATGANMPQRAGYPGGWDYDTPEALSKAIDNA